MHFIILTSSGDESTSETRSSDVLRTRLENYLLFHSSSRQSHQLIFPLHSQEDWVKPNRIRECITWEKYREKSITVSPNFSFHRPSFTGNLYTLPSPFHCQFRRVVYWIDLEDSRVDLWSPQLYHTFTSKVYVVDSSQGKERTEGGNSTWDLIFQSKILISHSFSPLIYLKHLRWCAQNALCAKIDLWSPTWNCIVSVVLSLPSCR